MHNSRENPRNPPTPVESRWVGPKDPKKFAEAYGFDFCPGEVYLTQYPKMGLTIGKLFKRVYLDKKTALLLLGVDTQLTRRPSYGQIEWVYYKMTLTFASPFGPQEPKLVWDTDVQAFGLVEKRLQAWRATYQSFRPLKYHKRYQNFHKKRGST